MGWIAVAAPYIAQGVGALTGYLGSRNAGKRSGEESYALTGAQNSANQLQQTGQNLLGAAQGPRNYFEGLLSGDRAQAAQATAGQRASINDLYRGAERGVDRAGIRGAARDVTLGELIRERAGKLAGLVSGTQLEAAQGLLGIAQMGSQQLQASGNIWAGLLGQGAANRRDADDTKRAGGAAAGKYLFDLASGIAGRTGGGSTSPTLRATSPTLSSYPIMGAPGV